jgi:hypothetical protein
MRLALGLMLVVGCGTQGNTRAPSPCDEATDDGRCVDHMQLPNVLATTADTMYSSNYFEPPLTASVTATAKDYLSQKPVAPGKQVVVVDGSRVLVHMVTREIQTARTAKVRTCPGDGGGTNFPGDLCGTLFLGVPGDEYTRFRLLGGFDGFAFVVDTKQTSVLAQSFVVHGQMLVASGLPSGFPFGTVDATGIALGYGTAGVFVIPRGDVPTMIAAEPAAIVGFATDADQIYWATPTQVRSCPRSPVPCQPGVVATGTHISGVAIDAQDVYWIDDGELFSCPRAGCAQPSHVIACLPFDNDDGPALRPTLVVDADSIYCRKDPAITLRILK